MEAEDQIPKGEQYAPADFLVDAGTVITNGSTPEQGIPGIKTRYRAFVARHEVAWELLFAGLAVVFVALAFVPVVPGSRDR